MKDTLDKCQELLEKIDTGLDEARASIKECQKELENTRALKKTVDELLLKLKGE